MRMLQLFSCAVLICSLSLLSSCADSPRTIAYEGSLTDSTGISMPDSTYFITFRIYGDSVTVRPLWMADREVIVREGRFSVSLGADTPLPDSVFTASVRWLGLQIGSRSEVAPRFKLDSSQKPSTDSVLIAAKSRDKNRILALFGSDEVKVVVTLFSTVIGVILTIVKIKSMLPRPRIYLKEDIEIRNSLKGNEEEYELVAEYVKNRLFDIYSEKGKTRTLLVSNKRWSVIAGLIVVLAGVYLTILVHNTESWSGGWYVGTIYIVILGVFVMSGGNWRKTP